MKRIKQSVLIVLCLGCIYLVIYLWNAFPIITGYSAKMACSCIYLGDRSLESVKNEELGSFPLRLATVRVNADSSVTAKVGGMASQTAVFRPGLGCTLVNEISKDSLRAQQFQLATIPDTMPDSIMWPMGDRLPNSLPGGVDEEQLHQVLQQAFVENDPDHPVRTRAVVVMYKGQLVAERYARGYDRHHRQLSWSMAKSITGTLIGMLVKNGRLKLDEPAPVPEWRGQHDGRERITLRQLLQQTSGLDFEENYSKSTDATKMLFRKADMPRYAASRLLREQPGTQFYYSSGNSNILSGILRQTLGDSLYHRFPYDSLFYPLGIRSAVMEPDAAGNFVGSSYVYATPRDWARLGLLYLQHGQWMGKTIVTEEWVNEATLPVEVAPHGEYGMQWWLNAGAPYRSDNRKFPELPADMYYMSGYEGQQVLVIPSSELVIVRLGQTHRSEWFNTQLFVNGILSAIPNR